MITRLRVCVALAVVLLGLSAVVTTFPAAASSTTPTYGGTLSFAVTNTLAPSLDPTRLAGGGTTGQNELGAIYDSLVNYNTSTEKYYPGTATVTSTHNFTVWTIKIHPGIKFTDGTRYDANAVKYNLERDIQPTSTDSDKALMAYFITSITVVNSLTVQVDLNAGWAGFPFVLSDDSGKIISPAQLQSLGSSFGSVPCPCGAGPFMIKSFTPGSSLDLVRNPHYWGPKPYLAGIDFITPSTDPAIAVAGVKTGEFDAAYITDPATVKAAKAQGLTELNIKLWIGSNMVFNAFSGPGTNPLVRKAFFDAINPVVINNRAYQGALTLDNGLVGRGSVYKVDDPGIKYNLSQAESLLAQAKAGGYNGQITLLTANDPVSLAVGNAVIGMADAAGFNATLNDVPAASFQGDVFVTHNYQVCVLGFPIDDSLLFFRLFQSYSTFANRYGYTSPAMDAALRQLRLADTVTQEDAALTAIQKVIDADAPYLAFGEGIRSVVSTAKVHGFVYSSDQQVQFGKVWLSK